LKIKILFVIDYFHRTGGTEKHLALLVEHLPRDRFDCTIVAFDLGQSALIDQIKQSGVPVIHVPVGREYTPNALWRASQLANIVRKGAFDIVQTFHQKSDTFGAIVAKLSGARHIISSKRDVAEFKKPWHFLVNRALRPLFERYIVVADAVGEVIAAKEGVERSRITRIYNGVDAVKFSPPGRELVVSAKARLGFAPGDFVVGMVAGFRPEKNYDVFFAAVAKAMQVIPELKVVVVGGGPLLEHSRGAHQSDTAAGKIVFAGDVADVSGHLQAMDVGCLIPGSNEGFSNAVLEKMAMGLPLIVTNVGGNAEAVLHGQNGLVIPPGDSGAFYEALLQMHSNAAQREEMGRKSRLFVEQKFTLQRMCEAHERLYSSIASAPS
jgi:glycosyltransferase involved in cell wall biosynthesis